MRAALRDRGARVCRTALILSFLIAVPAGLQAAPKDTKALDGVVAARARLDRLSSYRVTLTLAPGTVVFLTQGATVLIEVVNPNRYRSVFKMGKVGTAESITVGRQTRSRNTTARTTGRWECNVGDAPVQSLLPVIPARRDEIVSLTTLGETTVAGARLRGYQYQRKEGKRLGTYRLYTLPGKGLPRRVAAFSAQGRQDVTADYFDYDAPLTIELPPCG